MKHKVSELEGALLDQAVAMAEGLAVIQMVNERLGQWDQDRGCWRGWNPSTDWRDGGPIIERERISLVAWDLHGKYPYGWWLASACEPGAIFAPEISPPDGIGPTPLIAAMRAYAMSRLGDDVELP